MVPRSPIDALGPQADGTRELVIEIARSRHDQAAEGHDASRSRYAMGFGTQWRDLLDDAHEAFANRGFPAHKLMPAGYKIPIVNECLVYLWRVSVANEAVTAFASSPTRRNGFIARAPAPMLFEPNIMPAGESTDNTDDGRALERLVRTVGEMMPVVLVMIRSTPRQLQSIEWAIAELNDAGNVQLRGQETIWEPECVTDDETSDVESFDSGAPAMPIVELQRQHASGSDA